MNYKIVFEYVYTFYSFDEELDSAVRTESFSPDSRFTLEGQEDGSFTASKLQRDHLGDFVVITFPNTDKMIVRPNAVAELAYDEFFDSMGDNNHNVYIGTVRLKPCDL